MSQVLHNTSTPNDGLGDELRTAMGNQNAMNTELYNTKVDKVVGKQLSTNDYTNTEKNKLAGIEEGAQVNMPINWEDIIGAPEQMFSSVGYFHYSDLATQTTPLNVVASVPLKLTNDKLGFYTNEAQAPYGVPYVWDAVNNQFNFSALSIGDTLQLRVDLKIDTASANQNYTIYAKLGIGTASEYDLQINNFTIKTVTSNLQIIRDVSFSIDNTDWNDAPAEIYILSDGGGTVKVNGWYVPIIRKSVNVIDFADSFKYKGELNLTAPILTNGVGVIGDVYKVVESGLYDFGAGNIYFYGGDFIFYDGFSYDLFIYNSQLQLNNFADATLPISDSDIVLVNQSGVWKKTSKLNLGTGRGSEILITNASVSGTYNIDWSAGDVWHLTLSGNTTLTESNLPVSGTTKTINLQIVGNYTLAYPIDWTDFITGYFIGVATLNTLTCQYFGSTKYKVQIVQPD